MKTLIVNWRVSVYFGSIILAVVIGMGQVGRTGVSLGGVKCDTTDTFINYDNKCESKPGRTCSRPRTTCKASQPGNDDKYCEKGEGAPICSTENCVTTNTDKTLSECEP
jgi:hypothetical protein